MRDRSSRRLLRSFERKANGPGWQVLDAACAGPVGGLRVEAFAGEQPVDLACRSRRQVGDQGEMRAVAEPPANPQCLLGVDFVATAVAARSSEKRRDDRAAQFEKMTNEC